MTNWQRLTVRLDLSQGEQEFLKGSDGFDAARLVVVLFGRFGCAMTEQGGGDSDMRRILERDTGRTAISK
jgi:hypothetical protein